MTKAIIILITVIFCVYLLDKLFLMLEQKDWIYWRKKKPDFRGGIGNALQEFNSYLNPSSRYTIEAKQNKNKKSQQLDDND